MKIQELERQMHSGTCPKYGGRGTRICVVCAGTAAMELVEERAASIERTVIAVLGFQGFEVATFNLDRFDRITGTTTNGEPFHGQVDGPEAMFFALDNLGFGDAR